MADYRTLIGATDPKDAAPGTIRKDFADNKGENCVHGSDSAGERHHRGRILLLREGDRREPSGLIPAHPYAPETLEDTVAHGQVQEPVVVVRL